MQSKFALIAVDCLQPGHYQPRQNFDLEKLQELAHSIKQQGVIEPLVVRSIDDQMYEIVAGERRWRAAQLIGLDELPCMIRDYSDAGTAAVTLIENIQRENLNPIEEAQALQCLSTEFGYTHDQIADILGKSRAGITNLLRLQQLDKKVQQLLADHILTSGHGKILAGLPHQQQLSFAYACQHKKWSVRKLEQEIRKARTIKSEQATVSYRVNADIRRLERLLSENLGVAVSIESDPGEKESGCIKIRYYDNDTLSGVLQKFNLHEEI